MFDSTLSTLPLELWRSFLNCFYQDQSYRYPIDQCCVYLYQLLALASIPMSLQVWVPLYYLFLMETFRVWSILWMQYPVVVCPRQNERRFQTVSLFVSLQYGDAVILLRHVVGMVLLRFTIFCIELRLIRICHVDGMSDVCVQLPIALVSRRMTAVSLINFVYPMSDIQLICWFGH